MKLEHANTAVGREEDECDPVAAFKRRTKQYATHSTKEFEIPGYEDLGGMVAVYKRLDPDVTRAVLTLGEGKTYLRCAQFLLDACIGVYRRADDGLKPMWPANQAIRPSEAPLLGDLNTILDLECDDGRDVVVGVFQGNPFLVEDHADLVHKWMTSEQRADDDEAVKGR